MKISIENCKMDINTLESLPPEILINILKNITNPDEILRVSNTSIYLRNVLRYSIEKLETNEDLLYLDVGWLTQYPRLREVSDDIIFTIDVTQMKEFTIPKSLIKFNVRIYVPIRSDIQYYTDTTVIKYILNLLDRSRIYEYTIRFIHQFDFAPKYNKTLILDRSKIAKITNYSKTNVLFPRGTDPTMDYIRLFNDLNIKLININDPNDMNYYQQNKNNELMFIELPDMNMKNIKYPISTFKNFVNDIVPTLNANITKISGPDYSNTMTYFRETGYIDSRHIEWMIDKYVDFNNLYTRDNTGREIVQFDDIILRYFSHIDIRRRSKQLFNFYTVKTFEYDDKNIIPAHFYIEKLYLKLIGFIH